MVLKEDLEQQVKETFRLSWKERDGTVVPSDTSVTLGNDGINLKATVLYADMADSTKLVDKYGKWSATEIYKNFLYCAGRIIGVEGGTITAYDGDRVMAVFIGEKKNTSAVRAAMKIKWASSNIIMPAKTAQYTEHDYVLKQSVGIDTSNLFVAKTGIRGANDLVWVGRAANHAAKMSALPASYTYISADVYNVLAEEAKYSGGTNMWEAVRWDTFDNRTIYRSSYHWSF